VRVALVCPYSLSTPGGVQGQVLGLARALRAAGDEVLVVAPVDDRGPRDGDLGDDALAGASLADECREDAPGPSAVPPRRRAHP
jgi:hypothetical protein